MHNKFRLLLSLFLLSVWLFSVGCSGDAVTNKPGTPSPTPMPTKEEIAAEFEKEMADQDKAIKDFVATKYKGWELRGIAGKESERCVEAEPCDLHLSSAKGDKVVTVMLRKFHKPDASTYWFVYEATKLDIARNEVENLKQLSEELGRENERESLDELAAQAAAEEAYESQGYGERW